MSRVDRRRIAKGFQQCKKCGNWKKKKHHGKEQFLHGYCRKCFREAFKDDQKMLASWEILNEEEI